MISKIFHDYELCEYDLTSKPLFKNIRLSDNIYKSLKFKYSIAKSLNFKKYLEFRFTNNYSPVAFLDATPSSKYLSFNLSNEVSNDSLSSSISKYLKKYKFENLSNQNYYKYLKIKIMI